ncbi:MAG: NCS2 family nucleobase:cation symporter [Bacilli bacterium]|jgi:uracil permease|nr:NCS2 family nucleobase:cation symporter [Bacilli bacterium]
MEKVKKLLIGPQDKPKNKALWALLSFQHVFAMFGATVLVPRIIGLDPGVAIFTSGLGTIIYIICTKAKVPIYLGSSFAYINVSVAAMATGGHGMMAAGIFVGGIVYLVVSTIVRFTGMGWINRVIPPIVIGPMIMVIGLGLAGNAITSAGLSADAFNMTSACVALFTLLVTALISIRGKGFLKIIPILCGIISGYVLALCLGLVDTSLFANMQLFKIPNFEFPGLTYHLNFAMWLSFAPVALVTITEHIGEHSITSNICDTDFLKDEPGLKNTLLGDGIAKIVAGLIGGPANTTYGENNGVIAMTKVASVYVIALAALFAMGLAFFNPVTVFINSIPAPVMGGISIMLFGIIASNGVKVMIENKIDFNSPRNLTIAATMLVIGLGGAKLMFDNGNISLEGMGLAAVVGILLNLFLPKDKSFDQELSN